MDLWSEVAARRSLLVWRGAHLEGIELEVAGKRGVLEEREAVEGGSSGKEITDSVPQGDLERGGSAGVDHVQGEEGMEQFEDGVDTGPV